MPSLSPTMKDGKIIKWNVKIGDKVTAGDVIAEIQTDKSAVGFEVQDDGYIAQILAKEGGESIEVGKVVVIAKKKDSVSAFQNYSGQESTGGDAEPQGSSESRQQSESQPKPKKAASPKAGASFPPHDVLKMPSLSPTMKDGKIIKWNVKIGDKVTAGDVIAEIQTDKSAVGFEVQDDGYIAQILAKEGGESIEVGKPVVVIAKKKDSVSAFSTYTGESNEPEEPKGQSGGSSGQSTEAKQESGSSEGRQPKEQQAQQQAQTRSQSKSSDARPRQDGERVVATPYAKLLAKEKGLNIHEVEGSGPNGRIKAEDVLSFKPRAAEPKKQGQVEGKRGVAAGGKGYVDQPLSQMRKVIGQRLTESKQNLPHYYVTMEIRMDKLLKLRREVNEDLKDKLSVNDFIIKAAALACKVVPEVNSQWTGDNLRTFEEVDVSFAVAIENGLITPIVSSAESKSLSQIGADTKDLINRAKSGKLKPEEYIGGTFTISNLGMFGIKQFTAIINPPQACILAVGATEMVPVYNESAPNKIE
jgi:pyruvate dehydrogenase E2 component (dihydrolipoamide acetyltransferase)